MTRLLMWCMLLLSAQTWAAPGRLIQGGEANGAPPLDPIDTAWARAPAATARLYPQASAPDGPGGAVLDLEARVLRGEGRLAVRLTWPDSTEDLTDARATHRFADAAAVQFATAGNTLPYIGMGESGRPVRLWFWRAGRAAERLTAQGFGSLSGETGAPPEVQARRTATGWAVVLRGEAGHDAAIAFAVWDGAEGGRAGRKRLSAWQALAWPGVQPASALGEEARSTGDPVRGERLYAEHGCAACHIPASGLGPDLVHAGGIHWPGYLRRAIREPDVHRVPGYQTVMPALPLRPDELEDLAAYLLTLR